MKKAIVTNDDGINSKGISKLVKALSNYMDVYVFAPDCQKSAMSQALFFREPLTVGERKMSGAAYACEVSGSPADSVKVGLRYLEQKGLKADYVFSGINHGGNTGSDIVYSGTCGGAREGAMNGIRSIALSVNDHDATEFAYICSIIPELIRTSDALPPSTFLNVNAPNLPEWKVKGTKLTAAADHFAGKTYTLTPNDDGRLCYSIEHTGHDAKADNDFALVQRGYATVTPISIALTDEAALRKLRGMSFDNTFAVMIDLQERLLPAMRKADKLERNAAKLLRSLDRIGVPIIATEQYAKGLGRTTETLMKAAGRSVRYIDKVSFDAFGEKSFESAIRQASVPAGRKASGRGSGSDLGSGSGSGSGIKAAAIDRHVILFGAESHICLYLTAKGFIDRGFTVHVIRDCSGSRTKENHESAMASLAALGARVETWESVVYELLGDSRHPAFRTISAIVKED